LDLAVRRSYNLGNLPKAFVIGTEDGHADPSRYLLSHLKLLSQDCNDGLTRRRERSFFLGYALTQLTQLVCVAAKRSNLVPAGFRDLIEGTPDIQRDPTYCGFTCAT
jgi:hypothetical protein